MMPSLLTFFIVIASLCVIPISATVFCSLNLDSWFCSYQCCFSYSGCCLTLGSAYWYAWVIVVIFILLCICACAGAGGYGYRRYYYGRHVEYPPPTCTLVTNTTTTASSQGYQPFSSASPNQHQPLIKDSKAPPPYNPNEAYQPGPPKY